MLICGDREWTDEGTIAEYVRSLPTGSVIIHGACRGADRIAGLVAEELGYEVEPYPADWATFGRAAGVIRNRQMMDEGEPDLVIAFHSDISRSSGTADMLSVAERSGVEWKIITGEED